jgi:hypothetical protein
MPRRSERCCSASAALITFAAVQSSLSTGLIFGWPALVAVLRDEGIYADECAANAPDGKCDARDAAFASVYAMAAVVNYASFIPAGLVLDQFGPRVSSVLGTLCVVFGSLLLGLSGNGKDFFALGLSLHGVGSPFIHLAWFHCGNILPVKRRPLLSTACVGCFTVSGLVFVVTRWIVQGGTMDRRAALLLHAAIMLSFAFGAVLLHPKRAFAPGAQLLWNGSNKTENTVVADTSMPSASTNSALAYKILPPPPLPRSEQLAGRERSSSLIDRCSAIGAVVRSAPFLWLLLGFGIHSLRLNFTFAAAAGLLDSIADDGDGEKYLDMLALIMPAGVVWIPIVGRLLRKLEVWATFLVVSATGAVYGIFLVSETLWLQPIGFVIFSFHRVILFSSMFDYVRKTFELAHFGRLSGLVLLWGAAVSLVQKPLIAMAKDEGDYTLPLLMMLAAAAVPFLQVAWLWRRSHGGEPAGSGGETARSLADGGEKESALVEMLEVPGGSKEEATPVKSNVELR